MVNRLFRWKPRKDTDPLQATGPLYLLSAREQARRAPLADKETVCGLPAIRPGAKEQPSPVPVVMHTYHIGTLPIEIAISRALSDFFRRFHCVPTIYLSPLRALGVVAIDTYQARSYRKQITASLDVDTNSIVCVGKSQEGK